MPRRASSDWHRLPGGRRVRFTFDPVSKALNAEWRRPPANQQELDSIMPAYRAARDRFLSDVAPGEKVLVVEL